MKVHTYERAFLTVGALMLVAFMGALVYASVAMGYHLPGRGGEVDPAALLRTPPFDHPGVRQTGPNQYEADVVAMAWAFMPAEIRVPVNAEVTFVVSSVDVIHGFDIEGTRVNVMVIPGQITRTTYTFREPGQHLLICHEYCGVGHQTMHAAVIVE